MHSVPLGSGAQEICTAPTMLVIQPLKVLQINDTFVFPDATSIPIPVRSTGKGAVRPTALLEIVTFVLKLTEIPRSVPAPVIVLLSIVRLAAPTNRIAVDALSAPP